MTQTTQTKCDRCGKTKEYEKDKVTFGWYALQINFQPVRKDDRNIKYKDLCDECTADFELIFMKEITGND